jgi:flagellar biosynthesis anti-sigma factor FlgM
MRIDPQNPAVGSPGASGVDNTPSAQVKSLQQQPAAAAPSDTVELSSGQATVRQLVSQLSQIPDVRQEKVSSLRAAIGSGEYKPSGAQVADALAAQSFGASEPA